VTRAALLLCVSVALAGCARSPAADTSGRDTYLRHCASCHGAEGRGDGPLAGSLTKPPADLTQIAKRSGGRFDESAVLATIDGTRQVAAHGSRDMPVWGAVFEHEERGEPYSAYQSLLKSRLLMDYLATIQAE
jgi:mono/diheme cytochrome c family protein